ncbi:PAS domain-containing protein [Pedobacter gandavensis]|uniref:histidine kinase n=1 Tax=Pedobacter gandavensis TaxID=2679963 RepID=A0ABR6EVJ1_9SPHI|nr:PAS domain S-box protein [Pedobacter gandavensis]MBB2149037.1 PAS domain S-box protein [Pedobacter gandavensis]
MKSIKAPRSDITFEKQLKAYQKRISNILESFTDAFFEVDRNWTVTYWNKEAERMLQMPRKHIIGKNLWEVYAEAIPLKFYTEYHRAIAENTSVRFQEYFEPNKVWLEVAAFPSGEGLSVYFKDITAHKEATAQLQQEKQRYIDLFNLSPLPQWLYNQETLAFLDVNEAAIKFYGYTRSQFLKMTINDIRILEDTAVIPDVIIDHLSIGDINQTIIRHCKKNGDLVYVTIESNAVWFKDISACLGLVIDRTKQILAENALFSSEQRFKAMVQNGSDLIAIVDIDGGYKYASPAAMAILGIDANRLLEENIFNFIHPDDQKETRHQFDRIKKHKHADISPFRFKNSEGVYRWMETVMTNMMDDPAIQGMVCNSRDITEDIENKRKIAESIGRYNIVSKATSDVIWDWNMDIGIILWNKGVKEVFGYANTNTSQHWLLERIHPDDVQEVLEEFELLTTNKKRRLQLEYRFRCADGTYKSVLDRSFVIFDGVGKPTRIIGSMQDITERINHLNAIESQNRQLREIAWIQAHEIRAPLARIMGLVELLQAYGTDETLKDYLTHLKSSSDELDKVIRTIMKNAYPQAVDGVGK